MTNLTKSSAMTQGIDYLDEGEIVFDGFSFRLYGMGGDIEFIPTGLAYPEIANAPGQIVGVKVVLVAGSFRGEQSFDFPYTALLRLQADLNQWNREGDKGFAFPSPETVVLLPPATVECTVEHPPWSRREWQVHCRLSNLESADDPNTGRAVALEVHFMLTIASVDSALRDLMDFLRHVSSMAK
jgi:hypothetical protein